MSEAVEAAERPVVVYPRWYEVRRLRVRQAVRELVAGGERNAVSRLAQAVGVARQTASMVIHGQRWSPRVLELIERALGRTAAEAGDEHQMDDERL
ncbi:MAG: hypothetical protein AAGJ10_11990 [Bacteroidota bacterium]